MGYLDFVICFLLCRNGVAVVCSVVSDGLLEFCKLFSVM